MDLSLSGKRALVTGASSGLGLHFAGVLARASADVTLAARRIGKVDAAARDLRADGLVAEAVELDVTDPASVARPFDAGTPYDVVINNAGISGSGAALEIEIDAFRQVVDTNLTGVFAVAQAAAHGMAGRRGAIVNIASILGLRVAGHVAAYTAS